MYPLIRQGDLAISRRSDSYRVGDIIAFRYPGLGIVLHRIVSVEDKSYVTKGDHNKSIDGYRPVQSDVMGKLWFHIPGGGDKVLQLRTPAGWSIVTGIMGVLAMTSGSAKYQQDRRRKKTTRPAGGSGSGVPVVYRDGFLLLAAAIGIGSALLVMLSLTKSPYRTVDANIGYEQAGTFSYAGLAPPGVYDGEVVVTGDPVYLKLTNKVDVSFSYRFTAEAAHDVAGTYALVARIVQDNGWRRNLQLAPETPFAGDRFTVVGALDLRALQQLIAAAEAQSGVSGRGYKVVIEPDVKVNGVLAGQPLRASFAPPLTFQLDAAQLQLDRGSGAGTSGGMSDPLKPSARGVIPGTRQAPNQTSLLVVKLDVSDARRVSMYGLVVAGLLAGVGGLLAWRIRRADEPTRIRSQYGSLLLNLRGGDPGSGARVVEVASIQDLAKLATQDGRMILHKNGGTAHSYYVSTGEVVYKYRSILEADAELESAADATASSGRGAPGGKS